MQKFTTFRLENYNNISNIKCQNGHIKHLKLHHFVTELKLLFTLTQVSQCLCVADPIRGVCRSSYTLEE